MTLEQPRYQAIAELLRDVTPENIEEYIETHKLGLFPHAPQATLGRKCALCGHYQALNTTLCFCDTFATLLLKIKDKRVRFFLARILYLELDIWSIGIADGTDEVDITIRQDFLYELPLDEELLLRIVKGKLFNITARDTHDD